jgi:hypothetical protein
MMTKDRSHDVSNAASPFLSSLVHLVETMGGGSAPPPIPNNTVSDFSSVEELLNSVRHSLKLGPPYSSGVHDFSKDLVVYYDVQGQAQPRCVP